MFRVKERKITVLVLDRPSCEIVDICPIEASTPDKWKKELMDYLERGELPSDVEDAKKIAFRATQFTVRNGELYKKSFEGVLLRCLNQD